MNPAVRSWKLWALFLGFGGLCATGGALTMRGCTAPPGKEEANPVATRPVKKAGTAVVVLTSHPGMPAFMIEKTITNRIERWVNQSPGAMRVTSKSVAGVSIVHVYFRDDIDPNGALTMTGQLALGTLPTLPPDTLPPVVLPFDANRSLPLGVLAVSSPTVRAGILTGIAKSQVRNGLLTIPGAVAPVVLGGVDRTVTIAFDPERMEALHLSSKDVGTALHKAVMGFGGLTFDPTGDIRFVPDDNRPDLDVNKLEALALRGVAGKTVHLHDVARVTSHNFPQAVRTSINRHGAVIVPVYLGVDTSPKAVLDKVPSMVASVASRLPRDVNLQWMPFGIERDPNQPTNDGLLTIYVRAPSNASLYECGKRVAAIEQLLEHQIPAKGRAAILSELGMQPDWTAIYTANAGPQDATIRVQLSRDSILSAAGYASVLRRLIHKDAAFADLGIRFASRDMPAPVDVRIVGEMPGDQLRLARVIRRRLATIRGTADVDVAQRMDASYVVVQLDPGKATQVGLSSKDILDQTRAVMNFEVGLEHDPWVDTVHNEFYFRFSDFLARDHIFIEALRNVDIRAPKVKYPLKLTMLVTVRRATQPVEIDHADLMRVFNVRANIDGREHTAVLADVRQMLKELHVPNGMRVELATRGQP